MTNAGDLPFPAYPHLPGGRTRAERRILETVAAQAETPPANGAAWENTAWLYGLRLFNAGYYWESHELFEALWRKARPNSRERFLLQGLIHIANLRLKLLLQRPRAAIRLAWLAEECLHRAFPLHAGSVIGFEYHQLRALVWLCSCPDSPLRQP